MTGPRRQPRAFTLAELLVVVLILGILAAVTVPRFAGATDEARTASAQSTLGAVRSSIATFRMNAVISGSDPYPTLSELQNGTVVRFELPPNPYSGVSGVQGVSESQALSRAVVGAQSAGWNYFVDNEADPPVAIFYANDETVTTQSDGAGGFLGANEL